MLKVLIADDEQLICSMINKMIDWEGRGLALAGMANNGLDVLDQIRELHPDIVITDIRMPGLTGLELIEEAMKIDDSLALMSTLSMLSRASSSWHPSDMIPISSRRK